MDFITAYEQLKQGTAGPVYLLHGHENWFVERFVERLKEHSEAVQAVRFDYEEDGVEEALLELQTVSLFQEPVLVIIRNCTPFLSQGKANGQAEMLEAYLQNPVSNRTLVLTVNAEKLDERKKITKAAKRHLVVNCSTPKEPVALRLLKAEAAKQNIAVDEEVFAELWRRTGAVSVAANELAKLALYAQERSVTVKDVKALVAQTLEESVFDWIDHVVQGQLSTAIAQLVDIGRQGYEPLALLAMLTRQIRMMWYAKVLGGRGMRSDEIAKEAKVHPFAMKVADRQARNFSVSALESLLLQSADHEYDIKRGRRDPHQAVELLILSCAQSMSGKRRAQ